MQKPLPGYKPTTDAERLRLLADKPLRGADQKACNIGLFDEAARDQIDLVDLIKQSGRKP